MSEAGILLLGVLIGLIYFELFKVSPGGILSAGYLLFFFLQPLIVLNTMLIAFITLILLLFLSRYLFLFGRRTLLIAIIIGFLISWASQQLFGVNNQQYHAMLLVGYFVPGEIAYECRRQGIWSTLLALSIVLVVAKVLLLVSQSLT